MEITITVPDLKCTRCSAVAPLEPHLLYLRGQAPKKFHQALSDITRERSDASAKDTAERTWEVFTAELPAGWSRGPSDSDLCVECTAKWLEAGREFMVPPPPPIVEELAEETPIEVVEPEVPEKGVVSAHHLPTTRGPKYVAKQIVRR